MASLVTKTLEELSFSATRWSAISMIGRSIIAFSQLIILARTLDPVQIGLVALTLTVTNTAQMISDLGISSALIHYREQTENELRSLYWLNVLVGLLLTLLVASISLPISKFYRSPGLEYLLQLASIYFFVWAIGQQYRVLAERNLKFGTLAKIELVSALFGFLLTVSLSLLIDAMAVVVGFVSSATLNSILTIALLRKNPMRAPRLKIDEVSKYIKYGTNILFTNIANTISLQSDVIIVGRAFGGTTLGLYSQPRELCLRIMFAVNPIITRVAFPLMATAKDDKFALMSFYHKTIRMTASINFPIYFFIALFSEDITLLTLGEKWKASAELMQLLAIWCAMRSIGNPTSSLLFSTGHTRRALISSVSVLALLFGVCSLGAAHSVQTVIYLLILSYAVLIPVFWAFLIRPITNSSFLEYHKQIAIPMLCALCAVLAASTSCMSMDHGLIRASLGAAVGGLSYLTASYFFNRAWIYEIVALIYKKIEKSH